VTEGDRFEIRSEDIAAEVVGGEAVILNLSSGVYYSLQGAGAIAWALLESGHTAAEAGERIAAHYDVPVDRATADLAGLSVELADEGLIAAADRRADSSALERIEMPPGGNYIAPTLERYSDMGDLLALDPPMPGLAEVPWQSPRG
jgi:Coenzyme PQQ synthesis protein D (PqqD)